MDSVESRQTLVKKIYFFLFGSKHISIMCDDLVDAPQWAPS